MSKPKLSIATLVLAACAGTTPPIAGSVVHAPTKVDAPAVARGAAASPVTVGADLPSRGEIEWAFAELMEVRRECGRDPWHCRVDDLAVPGTAIHGAIESLMKERRTHAITASSRGSIRYRVDGVEQPSTTRARVAVCLTDDVVLMMKAPGDGPLAVFDESLVSERVIFVLDHLDAGWRWSERISIEQKLGDDLCAFE